MKKYLIPAYIIVLISLSQLLTISVTIQVIAGMGLILMIVEPMIPERKKDKLSQEERLKNVETEMNKVIAMLKMAGRR